MNTLFEECFDIVLKMMLHVTCKNKSIIQQPLKMVIHLSLIHNIMNKQNRKNKHYGIQKHMAHINNYKGFQDEKYKHSFVLRRNVYSNRNFSQLKSIPCFLQHSLFAWQYLLLLFVG